MQSWASPSHGVIAVAVLHTATSIMGPTHKRPADAKNFYPDLDQVELAPPTQFVATRISGQHGARVITEQIR